MRPREYKLDVYTYIVDHMACWMVIVMALIVFIFVMLEWVRWVAALSVFAVVILLCLEYRDWEKHYK